MKNIIKKSVTIAALFSISLFASAQMNKKIAQPNLQNQITAADIKASPELGENMSAKSSTPSMRCLVDTPAWDSWRTGHCFSVGRARTTTAYFAIDNAPSNYTIIWSDSRCNSSSTTCALPIRQYQSLTLTATVLNNSNNTFTTTQATAGYEGYF